MSYIIKDNNVVLNTKLTNIGRKLLAQGKLNFTFYAIGDSEINYQTLNDTDFDGVNCQILRPKDQYPDINSYLKETPNSTTKYLSIPSSNINVQELLIINSSEPRGFFTSEIQNTVTGFTLNSGTTYYKGKTTYNPTDISGNTYLKVADTSYANIGDYLLVNWVNPNYTGATDINTNIITGATPFLWYKIIDIVGNTFEVDRNVPNFNNATGNTGSVYIFPSGNSINEYYSSGFTQIEFWNPNTLNFNSSCIASENIPVLNCNIIYFNTQEGVDTTVYEGYGEYGSYSYYGLESLLSVLKNNPEQKAIGVIHYSNNALTNLYGEGFYESTLQIDLPTIMSHKTNNNIGVTLYSDSIKKTEILNSNNNILLTTTYYDLLLKDTKTGISNIVGKVFNDLKIVVIEDAELLAAMSYKSNRNWTYPKLSYNINSFTNSQTKVLDTNETLYVTYLLENTLPYSSTTSFGLKTSLHCQDLLSFDSSKLNINTEIPAVKIDTSIIEYYKDSDTLNNGQGYTATNLKLIMQKVTTGNKPNPDDWKVVDITNKLSNYSSWSGSTIPKNSLGTSIEIDGTLYDSASTYILDDYLNIPLLNETENLQFGDEVFLFGTLKTDIKATVYRTKYSFNLPDTLFNTSTNSTWEDGFDTYITEIAIYDSTNKLVAISKLSNPIRKNASKTVIIEVDLDF